ncbi:DNA cytosine methyltransferase [Streptomyces sp. NPDC047082]|uniref:DNA cytosine methyltransferase n=1 Tax=Streptomyces sp. NPDC047082 TaxID=3155259 RepID=UPI0033FBAB36
MSPKDESLYRVIDLFAGCGGFTQGFYDFSRDVLERHGSHAYAPIAGVEIEASAALTYYTNFEQWADVTVGSDHHFFLGDISDWVDVVKASEIKADVILGGPPCQGFSGLGKGDPDDPKNQLWEEYFKIVELVEPRIFIIENVDRFKSSRQIEDLTQAFADIGYTLEEPKILNAADYGAAQLRKRTIVIGVRGSEHIGYPEPTHEKGAGLDELPFDDALESAPGKSGWVTLRECLLEEGNEIPYRTKGVDLPPRNDEGVLTVSISRKVTETGVLDKEFVSRLREKIPGPFRSHQLHFGRTPSDISRARYRVIKEGQNRHALTAHDLKNAGKPGYKRLSTDSWDRHNNGSGDVMGRLEWEKPSVTIRTEFFKPEKGRYLHPKAHRPLTHYEASRIQGFDKEFRWCGSKNQIARQIGNAVPVPLARELAKHVYRALKNGAGLRSEADADTVSRPQE